jgi:hypothetical protein
MIILATENTDFIKEMKSSLATFETSYLYNEHNWVGLFPPPPVLHEDTDKNSLRNAVFVGKRKFVPVYAMKALGGVEVGIHAFLTFHKLEVRDQVYAPVALPLLKVLHESRDPQNRCGLGGERNPWPYGESNHDSSVFFAII